MARLLVLWLLLSPALFGGERFSVDPREGDLGGKQAFMDFPKTSVLYKEDLADCRVILAPAKAPEQRISFPCGTWYVPPAVGQYLTWLEDDIGISKSQGLINYAEAPYKGMGSVATANLVPAGFARVQNAVPTSHTVRYLHLDSPGVGFQLRVAGDDAARPVRIPEGRIVAGIFGPDGRAVLYSRPSTITAGEMTTFRLEPPNKGADLVAILRKPRTRRERTADLQAGGKAPDVQYESDTHVVAVWYALPPRPTTVTSATLNFQHEVALKERAVGTVREKLKD